MGTVSCCGAEGSLRCLPAPGRTPSPPLHPLSGHGAAPAAVRSLTATSCAFLLLKTNQQSHAFGSLSPAVNCENRWEFFFYSPSLSSSAEQDTSNHLTCHSSQEVLKYEHTSIFYTNCNGSVYGCDESSDYLSC